jgi:protein-S-isoprenylcysteine O-methyltransferase Ste14
LLVESFNSDEMRSQWLKKAFRQQGNSILCSFPISKSDLMLFKSDTYREPPDIISQAPVDDRSALMGVALNAFGSLLLLAALFAAALFVFAQVRSDYRAHGRLSHPIAILQVAYFCVYALASYAFLDSRVSHVNTVGLLFPLALVLMVIGFLLVVFSMPFLGQQSFGRKVGILRTNGLYQYSRNPQLVGSFIFIVGYAMLWPSWKGMLWASLWLVIAHVMVRGEEAHLENVFGDEYRNYCVRTPRYLGLPKK